MIGFGLSMVYVDGFYVSDLRVFMNGMNRSMIGYGFYVYIIHLVSFYVCFFWFSFFIYLFSFLIFKMKDKVCMLTFSFSNLSLTSAKKTRSNP